MKYFVKVENGPSAGTKREIPAAGLSVGRSEKNDLALDDGMLSRRHCRFTLQGAVPVVSDLATVNGTFVNGEQIAGDSALRVGDRILIGETELAIEDDYAAPAPAPAAPAPAPAAAPAAAKPVQPLFPEKPARKRGSNLAPAVVGACIAAVVVAVAAKFFLVSAGGKGEAPAAAPEKDWPLEFSFVKVEGTGENIFRYEMSMSADGVVSVSVSDLSSNRHLSKSGDGPVSDDVRNELRRAFETSGFLSLDPLYEGTPRQNTWRDVRISALYGTRAASVEVKNRAEPESFKALRERLEAFGRNELGLWAFAFGRDKLLELAREEFARGERLWAEREVRRDNVHAALRAYRSSVEYLDSLDPKPELYDMALDKAEEAERQLAAIVSDLNWKADHNASVKDWAAARQALRELLDVVPDRTDPRNKAALARLRDVEARLSK